MQELESGCENLNLNSEAEPMCTSTAGGASPFATAPPSETAAAAPSSTPQLCNGTGEGDEFGHHHTTSTLIAREKEALRRINGLSGDGGADCVRTDVVRRVMALNEGPIMPLRSERDDGPPLPPVATQNVTEDGGDEEMDHGYRNGQKVLYVFCMNCVTYMYVTKEEYITHLVERHNAVPSCARSFVSWSIRNQRRRR